MQKGILASATEEPGESLTRGRLRALRQVARDVEARRTSHMFDLPTASARIRPSWLDRSEGIPIRGPRW